MVQRGFAKVLLKQNSENRGATMQRALARTGIFRKAFLSFKASFILNGVVNWSMI